MSKIFEKLLQDFKKSNEAAREKMAARFGFKTAAELEAHLTQQLSGSNITPAQVVTTKKRKKKAQVVERITVHNVHILDASGSMRGPKFNAALKGINKEVEEMRKDNSTDVTQTVVHFSDPYDIQTDCWKMPLENVRTFHAETRGSTALLQTVGETLTKLLSEANGKDKVLVKIFTDGQENSTAMNSPWRSPKAVSDLIKECEAKGFTITFVGTEHDVAFVIRLLSIDSTNTLSHKNTAESIGASYLMSTQATAKFRHSASRGEDVTIGFYSKETGTL